MKFSQALAYIFTCVGIYLLCFVCEWFTIVTLLKGLELGYLIILIVSLCLLVIINPIITWVIVNKLPFKPKNLSVKKPL